MGPWRCARAKNSRRRHSLRCLCALPAASPVAHLPNRLQRQLLTCYAIGTREKLLESQLLAVVSPLIHRTYHPRTAIQLNVQIVEEGAEGNLLATAINSCVLALCDAGTPVKEMVAAANVGGVKEGKHTFAFGKNGSCVFADSVAGEDGGFVEGNWEKRVAEAKELCTGEGQILKAMKEVLMAKVQKDLRWKDLADDGSIVDEMEEDA